jgi:prepilin-type N-terminal cleavage/methylation domain-containing protein
MTRRGFTLIELLLAMTLTAILATALTRILVSDSRFVGQQDAMMAARNTARAAQNVTSVELRMVSDGGLLAAAADSVTVRVPYAFGVACGVSGGSRIASLMPVDSLMFATAAPLGAARRQADGTYTFREGITVTSTTDTASCVSEDIRRVPGGKWVAITPPSTAPNGFLFYLYQNVTFKFSASTDLPERIGLWRRVNNNAYEELVAPFDSTSRFRFLIGADPEPTDVVPGDLSTVAGLELFLVAESYVIPQGKSAYTTFELPIQIVFLNRAD